MGRGVGLVPLHSAATCQEWVAKRVWKGWFSGPPGGVGWAGAVLPEPLMQLRAHCCRASAAFSIVWSHYRDRQKDTMARWMNRWVGLMAEE